MSETSQPVVAINTSDKTAPASVIRRYHDIYLSVADEGATPIITRTGNFDPETGMFDGHEVIELNDDGPTIVRRAGRISVNAILSKQGSIKSAEVPVLNPEIIREICADKNRARRLLPDVYPVTRFVPSGRRHDDLHYVVDGVPGELLAVKRNRGVGISEFTGTIAGTKKEVMARVWEAEGDGRLLPGDDLLVEDYSPSGARLPLVQGINDLENDKLKSDNPKELRLYMIDNTVSFGVVRSYETEPQGRYSDFWIFIDQDSIPGEALTLAHDVVGGIGKVAAGSLDSYIAIDLFWNDKLGGWMMREANGRDPVYIKYIKSREFARRQRVDIGQKLAAMAFRHQAFGF